jgi:hypothetical protein
LTTINENWNKRMAALKNFTDRKHVEILASTTKSLQEQLATTSRQRKAQLTEQFAAYHQTTLTSTSQILEVNMEARISFAIQERLAVSMQSHPEEMAAVAERHDASLVDAVKGPPSKAKQTWQRTTSAIRKLEERLTEKNSFFADLQVRHKEEVQS